MQYNYSRSHFEAYFATKFHWLWPQFFFFFVKLHWRTMCVCGYKQDVSIAVYQFSKCRPWTHHDLKAFEDLGLWSDWKIITGQRYRAGGPKNASLAIRKSLFLWGILFHVVESGFCLLCFLFLLLFTDKLLCLFLFCQLFWCFSASVAS